ncbi:topoisomerase DNA-binding C4 zinc finger domain-containing protein [Candidatus Symbiopectobacterium sp. NZEC151]|nr:topoisomerase DNA-binding C4 zinc finger domain-containing protein [Candidatus Symbiopectobacterium sp. NZEC151]
MGRHPYAGRYKGPDISMSEAIAQNRFAFSLFRQNETQTTSPPGALTLDLFPDVVAQAFEKAFGLTPSARPDAKVWIQILTTLESSLNHCSKTKTHFYPSKAKGCVWCRLASNNAFDMFPDLSAIFPTLSTDTHGTEKAIQEIQMFRFPTADDLLPSPSSINRPSDALIAVKNSKYRNSLLGFFMMGAAVYGFIYEPAIFYVWIGLAIWGYSLFSERKVEQSRFLKAFQEADELVQHELDVFLQRNGLTEIIKVRGGLDIAITIYREQDVALTHDLALLKSNREARQLRAYLDSFSIRQANISGIGPAKTATLISFGIETAEDVNRTDVLRVPGFGKVMTGKLLDWRREKEAKFRYDQKPNSQDAADEKILKGRYAADKAKLENTIRNGLAVIKNAKRRLNTLPDIARADMALCEAITIRAQAEHDLKTLGLPVPISVVSLPIKSSPQPIIPPSKLSNIVTSKITPGHTRSASTVPHCPKCGSLMQRRSGKYGQFWGCQHYPRCKGTRN